MPDSDPKSSACLKRKVARRVERAFAVFGGQSPLVRDRDEVAGAYRELIGGGCGAG